MPDTPSLTDDLIRPRDPIVLTADAPFPSWAGQTLGRAPWVVVRRGPAPKGMIRVGARHYAAQRFAAYLAAAEIAERLTPEDPAAPSRVIDRERQAVVPALVALARVAKVLASRGWRWGPVGSIGFEIASGMAVATQSSDLDLILRQDRRLAARRGCRAARQPAEAAAPARVDVLLETPVGGVLLADLAAKPEQVLVRTPAGPRLTADPWRLSADTYWDRVS